MNPGRPFGWAVIGPGRIAHRFAGAVQALPDTHLAAVWGRDAARAEAFAHRWSAAGPSGARPGSTTELDALLRDPSVDGVYVATPHAQHQAFAQAALQAGKPVLCEKPLVPCEAAGRPLVESARREGVFLMEAVWSRYLPIYEVVAGWLRDGAIGALRSLQSSFCFHLPFDPADRCFAPEAAGGALLDIGVYNLTMTRWALAVQQGRCPEPASMDVQALLAPTGVDQRLHATLHFPGGIASQFVCGFDGTADNSLRLNGEHGHITVHDGFWHATRATLARTGEPPVQAHRPFATNGFEYQVAAAMRAIRAGRIEETSMPHDETLATLRWMDALRARMGVRYPFE